MEEAIMIIIETCPKCGSDDVITLRNSDGSRYEHCNTCGHNEPS